jgi:hypothetical protein
LIVGFKAGTGAGAGRRLSIPDIRHDPHDEAADYKENVYARLPTLKGTAIRWPAWKTTTANAATARKI